MSICFRTPVSIIHYPWPTRPYHPYHLYHTHPLLLSPTTQSSSSSSTSTNISSSAYQFESQPPMGKDRGKSDPLDVNTRMSALKAALLSLSCPKREIREIGAKRAVNERPVPVNVNEPGDGGGQVGHSGHSGQAGDGGGQVGHSGQGAIGSGLGSYNPMNTMNTMNPIVRAGAGGEKDKMGLYQYQYQYGDKDKDDDNDNGSISRAEVMVEIKCLNPSTAVFRETLRR